MKLIDGHAMIRRVEALYKRGAVDLSYYNIVKEAVQMETAVDAIPVEWLKHRLTMAQKHGSAHPEQAIRYVLWLWEQQKDGEQETHGT